MQFGYWCAFSFARHFNLVLWPPNKTLPKLPRSSLASNRGSTHIRIKSTWTWPAAPHWNSSSTAKLCSLAHEIKWRSLLVLVTVASKGNIRWINFDQRLVSLLSIDCLFLTFKVYHRNGESIRKHQSHRLLKVSLSRSTTRRHKSYNYECKRNSSPSTEPFLRSIPSPMHHLHVEPIYKSAVRFKATFEFKRNWFSPPNLNDRTNEHSSLHHLSQNCNTLTSFSVAGISIDRRNKASGAIIGCIF